jgi:hypothetical protein
MPRSGLPGADRSRSAMLDSGPGFTRWTPTLHRMTNPLRRRLRRASSLLPWTEVPTGPISTYAALYRPYRLLVPLYALLAAKRSIRSKRGQVPVDAEQKPGPIRRHFGPISVHSVRMRLSCADPGAQAESFSPLGAAFLHDGEAAITEQASQHPPPPPPPDAASVHATIAAERQQQDTMDYLQAELLKVAPGTTRAPEILDRLAAITPAPPAPSGDFTWATYQESNDHVGTPRDLGDRVRVTAQVAGWSPVEATAVLAALEDLAGKDPALMEPIALSSSDRIAADRALDKLPDAERVRLRDLGWFKSDRVLRALSAIGRRMGRA